MAFETELPTLCESSLDGGQRRVAPDRSETPHLTEFSLLGGQPAKLDLGDNFGDETGGRTGGLIEHTLT